MSTADVELLCGAARAEETKRKRPVAAFIFDEVMIKELGNFDDGGFLIAILTIKLSMLVQ